MKNVLAQVQKFNKESLSYERLGEFVKGLKADDIAYESLLPSIEGKEDYQRNILTLDPFEVVLLHWPPGSESAIHYHQGFWGYVLVLEGECDNVEYNFTGKQLREKLAIRGMKGGVFDEPDGTIHKLKNASFEKPLVTAHFYAPALETFDGMVLYREDGTIGILSDDAESASFSEPEQHFKELKRNAFEFVAYRDRDNAPSHRIYPVVPKPASSTIGKMISSYYAEQAQYYDSFDLKHESRRSYTQRINGYIAEEIQRIRPNHLIDIACGTGRRAMDIRERSGLEYEITGIDISKEMTNIAQSRGIHAIHSHWLDAEVESESVDVVTFLYAFGHIATNKARREALKKIRSVLRPGGEFLFDVFNMNDKSEWGPKAVQRYEDLSLDQFGYERGDVFYKKVGGKEIAFLHYFDEGKLRSTLEEEGFKVDWIKHIGYVSNSGQEVDDGKGALFVKAVRI